MENNYLLNSALETIVENQRRDNIGNLIRNTVFIAVSVGSVILTWVFIQQLQNQIKINKDENTDTK